MRPKKKIQSKRQSSAGTVKTKLHPRSKHRDRYDFKALIESCPELAPFVVMNSYDDGSIDFFNPAAVKMLNKALLMHYYRIVEWDLPENYLCPPIPGRADYIHYMADLLKGSNRGKIPRGPQIKCMDIGVGSSCIYPIIGVKEYGWSFIGTDIDPVSVASAERIIASNPMLAGKVEIRLQRNAQDVFAGVLKHDEYIDLVVCNPPFHSSAEEARASTMRKLKNLKRQKVSKPTLNFGGQSGELWREGGVEKFLGDMIRQSKQFSTSCFWFSSLVSKQSYLKGVLDVLKKANAVDVRTIAMGQGNKTSQIVAWTFLDKKQQRGWVTRFA
ncbi:MAG: 23S rRNA (adenine(1618)-N(6))-methyltransferase RlmF [Bacteroidetes bacterium]|nr:MAG: 23S rRNA (adenine(1618)-N(6))-methyltransferase RlmF [Bacteroidota bacterium]